MAIQIAHESWSGVLKKDVEGILTHYALVDRETFPVLLLRFLDPDPNDKVRPASP